MNEFEIREALAESGKTRVNDMMAYLKHWHAGKYDVRLARKIAKELVAEMKPYLF